MADIFDDKEKAIIVHELQERAAKHGIPVMVFTSPEALVMAADNMALGASLKVEVVKQAVMAKLPVASERVH